MDLNDIEVDDLEDYLSTCFVHLTRDDTGEVDGGDTARRNLRRIIDERMVRAVRPHCLYAEDLPPKVYKECRCCCFSQTPAHRLQRIIGKGYTVKLEPYGIVFHWDSLKKKGIQPVQYINSHIGYNRVRSAANRLLAINQKSKFTSDTRWLLPYMSAWHERVDFTWEREWRIVGDLTFRKSDVVCIVLPERWRVMRDRLRMDGFKVISAEWSSKKILRELAEQYQTA